ncbi:MAG: helix-turn-helix domain-containing protein [Rickettsiales bacterium]|nr:helix-turn-helix domain-containing protein [Rickettsiales bacterium]
MTDYLDLSIGEKMRQMRLQRGLTQKDVGKIMGFSFQQVQKYEKGLNRISAGQLYQLCQNLGVSVSHFFEGLPSKASELYLSAHGDEEQGDVAIGDRQVLELCRDYRRIQSSSQRQRIAALIKTLAEN